MKRPVPLRSRVAAGFTLIEILVATTLSLLLLGAVVWAFADIGGAITNSRSMLEMAEKLRLTGERLQMDLAGATAIPNPPLKPENNQGYIEIIKGPIGSFAVNTDNSGAADPTVGNIADILMLTTRSTGRPFVGRCINPTTGTTTIQSDVAEVAWFIRGRTLHRRVLLVGPGIVDPGNEGILQSHSELGLGTSDLDETGFYANYDISARVARDSTGKFLGYTPNTLGDLTRRECRFAHCAASGPNNSFPFDVRNWYWNITASLTVHFPTLPTLNECSSPGWTVDRAPTVPVATLSALDFWTNNASYRVSDTALTGANGTRVADDIILTNVIGFDVKVWDRDAGAYVDLGYHNDSYATAVSRFSHFGHPNSQLVGTATTAKVYDTDSTSYAGANAANGFDDLATGIVDSDSEKLHVPPYPYPLRGIQVKIRTFEPDSKQIREVTVVQDFLPQ